jgi:ATP-dependent Clp protease ATP-binding subunit ClpC
VEIAMYERFTDRARKVMQLANQEAQRFHHEYIGTEHILLGLIKDGDGVAANVLKNLDVDLRKVRKEVEKIVQTGPGVELTELGRIPQTPRAKKVIEYSVEEARKLNHNYVGTEHLLLGLLREEEGVAAQVLLNMGLDLNIVRAEVLNLLGHKLSETSESPSVLSNSKTPALDTFGRDLTGLAGLGRLNSFVGRRTELRSVFEVLGCRDGRSPLLLGESGVGKAALVVGLAQAIVKKEVPEWLRDHRVVELHVTRLWGDSDDWTGASKRVQAAFNEARRTKNLVLFVPDLIATLGAGGGLTARHVHAELLLTIRRGQSQCILAAAPADYGRCVERWGSMGTSVQPVAVRPASLEETAAVLHSVRARYEQHHRVRFVDGALYVVAELASQRLPGAQPGKAVALLDRCAARARLQAWEAAPPVDRAVVELDAQIRKLNEEKEMAVGDQDFQKAANLRDQADRLKVERDRLVTNQQQPEVVVDVALVEEVVRDLAPSA